jgi:hypothetical protein
MTTLSMLGGMEEGRFERFPQGWIFVNWNPWIVGPRWSYFVGEAQKPAILARLRQCRLVRIAFLLAILPLEVLIFLRFPFLRDSHVLGSWIAFAVFVAVFTVATAASESFLLRPLVRDLPRAPRKARRLEALRNQSHAMSLKILAALSAFCALASAGSSGASFMNAEVDLFSMLGAILAAFGAVLFFSMLMMKVRSE